MRVQLLGTGGAEGIPAFFEPSRVSRHAREHGGKDVRSRSCALINDDLKIDLGPDSWHQIARYGVDATQWSAIVYTHSHEDHFCPSELQYALYPFTGEYFAPFTIYGNAEIARLIWERYPEWPLEIVETKSFEPFQHGLYTITPLKAYHKLDEDAHNLLISDGAKTLLYATDTGIWQPETWEFMQGKTVDAAIVECTEGKARTPYYGHMDIHDCAQFVAKLRDLGCLSPASPVFTTHHGHLGDCTHEELEMALCPKGIQPGFDGLTFEV